MTSRRQTPRAIELLRKLVETGRFDHDRLAGELVVTPAQLEAYLHEDLPMPLDRQLCLAQFTIERVPALARLGHRLRGQVGAAVAFNEHITATHADAPPSISRR